MPRLIGCVILCATLLMLDGVSSPSAAHDLLRRGEHVRWVVEPAKAGNAWSHEVRGARLTGIVVGYCQDSLAVAVENRGDTLALAFANVIGLEVKRRKSLALEGALLGGLTGVFVGGSLGANSCEGDYCALVAPSSVALGVTFGALIGIGVGAAVGSSVRVDRWQSPWPHGHPAIALRNRSVSVAFHRTF